MAFDCINFRIGSGQTGRKVPKHCWNIDFIFERFFNRSESHTIEALHSGAAKERQRTI